MVSKEVCTMPKEEGGLNFIDVATQGHILAAKWIVRCLEGFHSMVDPTAIPVPVWPKFTVDPRLLSSYVISSPPHTSLRCLDQSGSVFCWSM